MDFEKLYIPEKKENGRERLLSLEKEGNVVFHGSPDTIKILEPHQAYGENDKTGHNEKDGDPAVFATQFADIAIFRSLINERLDENDSRCGMSIDNDDNLYFRSSANLLEKAKERKGNVYVLRKDGFFDFKGLDCRNGGAVVPIEVVEVNFNDLPKDIDIVDSD